MKTCYNLLISFLFLTVVPLFAQDDCIPVCCEDSINGIRGKFELAPAYVHIDILRSGHTTHAMDMAAIRADASYRIWERIHYQTDIAICTRPRKRLRLRL